MKKREIVGLFVALLAIPAIALAVAQAILSYENNQFQQGAASDFAEIKNPTPDQQKVYDLFRKISLQQFCGNPTLRAASTLESDCSEEVDPLVMITTGAEIAGAVGIGLIFGIAMFGLLARSSRTMLVLLFLPGLYLTLIVLVALIALHAGLLIAALYYVCALAGRIPIGIMIAIGIGAVLGIIAIIQGAFGAVRRAETTVLGKSRKLEVGDPLRGFLEHLTKQIGTAMPENVVVGFTPNFFVTEAKVRCLDGELNGRTLYLSLPLARILTQPELGAVLGHELGHFEGSDTKFSRWFYPIYRGTGQALSGLNKVSQGEDAAGLALLPAISALRYFLDRFATAESRLGRQREIAADAVGAKVTNPRACASALMKVHAFAPLWTNLYKEMREMLEQKKQFINASSYWASKVALGLQRNPNFVAEIDTSTTDVGHPTDTHPPLGVRLKALQVPLEVVVADAAQCSPLHPAIELIPEHDEIEKELSDIESALLAGSVNVSPENPQQVETSVETPVPERSEQVSAVVEKARRLADGEPTVHDLLSLMHEADDLAGDRSISVAERFNLRRISDAVKDILDTTTAIPDSPEREKLRQDRARYKEMFTPEFDLALDYFCADGSPEHTRAFGDLLFPKQYRARLFKFLENATDAQKEGHADFFADWVRLKDYSPSQVAEVVDVDVIQLLTSWQSASRESISQSETESKSENVSEPSHETPTDNDASELIKFFATNQLKRYAFSNPDLLSAFFTVLEAVDSPQEMGRRTVDFVAQAARIAGRPVPESLRETIDFLKEQSMKARPDPKLIGDLLSFEWLNGKFQSDANELSGELKPEIQQLAKGWLKVWWLYLFRARVAMTYGNDFMSAMMDQVHQKFRKLAELDRDNIGLSGRIDYWMTSLDDAVKKFKDVPLGKEKAPAEYIAALCFLMKDSESPYYKQSRIEDDVDTKVALAFVTMRARVTEWIDSVIFRD
jgi:Zn-dependent protease with chaperone function